MAVGTDDVTLGVLAAADIGAGNGLAVAAQAGIQDFFGSKPRKRDGNRGLAASGVYVVLAGAMAALAPGVFGLLFARRNAFIVGIAEKQCGYVGMAGAADIAADVVRCRQRGWGHKREKA